MEARVLLLLWLTISLVSAQTVEISGTSAMLGASSHILTCTLMGSAATDLEYQWSVGGSIEQPFSPNSDFVLFTVQVSNAQEYSCDVREMETGTTHTETAGLHVTIPSVLMAFGRDNPTNPPIPYIGSNISYNCHTLFPANLLVDLTGSVEITGPGGTPIDSTEGRVRVSENTEMDGDFGRTLYFSPLSAEDAGMYRCTGTIQPVTPNPLISNGMGSITQTIIIIGLQFEVEMTRVTGRYLVIEPYNNLSLTCSAAVTLRGGPAPLNMEFSWMHSVDSGPQEDLTSDLSRVFGASGTSTLTVLTEQPGNHTYTCQVSLDVRPAPDNLMKERSISLEVIGPTKPRIPKDLGIPSERIFSENVTVQWQVTSLSYDQEFYRVLYGHSGEELDMTSPLVNSTGDITVTNLSLSVPLTGLTAGTRYEYMLVASNSAGVTQSTLQSFTTTSGDSGEHNLLPLISLVVIPVLAPCIVLIIIVYFLKCTPKRTSRAWPEAPSSGPPSLTLVEYVNGSSAVSSLPSAKSGGHPPASGSPSTAETKRIAEDKFKKNTADLWEISWKSCEAAPIENAIPALVKIGDYVYAECRIREQATHEKRIFKYSITHGTWSTLPSCHGTYHQGLTTLDDELIAVGGKRAKDKTAVNTVYTFRGDEWKDILPAMPTPRWNLTAISHDNSVIIAAGGTTKRRSDGEFLRTDTVELYKRDTKSWYTTKRLPFELTQFSMCITDGTCYILGGGAAVKNYADSSTTLYATVTSLLDRAVSTLAKSRFASPSETWEKFEDKHPLTYPSLVEMDGRLVAMGGSEHCEDRNGTTVVSEYNFSTKKWVMCTSSKLKQPLYSVGVLNLGSNKVMVVGGEISNRSGNRQLTSAVYIGSYKSISQLL